MEIIKTYSPKTKIFFDPSLLWRILLSVLAIGCFLNALVLFIRLHSVFTQGTLFQTSGMEELSIYGVWKVVHGYSLLEWPGRYYAITHYNYLFYYVYAAFLWPLNLAGPQMMIAGKCVTLLFALLGAYYSDKVLRHLVRAEFRIPRSYTVMMAFLFWFGVSFGSWWSFAIRPDVPSLALACAGLYYYLSAKESAFKLVLSSFLFFFSWGFKQSNVSIFLPVFLYSLFRRRPKEILALGLPFAACVLVSFTVGGRNYALNLMLVALIARTPFDEMARQIRQMLDRPYILNFFANSFGWFFWMIALLPVYEGFRRSIHFKKLFALSILMSGLWCFYSMTAKGASRNHLFEVFLVVFFLSAVVMAIAVEKRAMAAFIGGLGLISIMAIGCPLTKFTKPELMVLASKSEYAKAETVSAYLLNVPKPVFYEDSLRFSMPWHSTDNRYPAFPLDNLIYYETEKRGLVNNGGISGLIRNHYFSAMILLDGSFFYKTALEAQYVPKRMPRDLFGEHVFLLTKS